MFHKLRWPLTYIFYSLRWRLTGWYVLLLTGVLLLFSAGTYVAVYKLLLNNFDDLLASQANVIVQTIDFSDRGLSLQNDALRAGRRSDEYLTRIYRADRKLLFDDNPREQAPELAEALGDALDGEKRIIQVHGREGQLRVISFPIVHDGRVVGALQMGLTLEDLGDTMRTLLKVMLLMAPAMLLVASGGGLFLANRALAPIDRITRTAQRISAEGLSQRIDLRDSNGWMGSSNDEVGRLAHTFDAMLARLQAAFEQQRRFAADASHELRTPLTAIIGQIDVAIERPRNAESYRATLVTVREQAQRLARLANDLLFLARADAQPTPAAEELIDLGDLLPAIVAQVEPLAGDRRQQIVLEQQPALFVRVNEDDLIRLLLNLLDNAIRYSPQGGRIAIKATACEVPGRGGESAKGRAHERSSPTHSSVAISIHDSGPGIAPEHLPRLFDRFFRADRGRNRAQGGSGLGLAIAQSIARAHGGHLEVASVVGQGSTFTAILPGAEAITYAQERIEPPKRHDTRIRQTEGQ